jgi:hypothetical protein
VTAPVTYLCAKGCVNPKGHPNEFKPKRHQNKAECPYEPKLGTPPTEPVVREFQVSDGAPSAPTRPLVKIRPLNPAAPGVQDTQRRIADIIRDPIPVYWVLDGEGTRKAWRLGFGGLYFVIEKGHPFVADYLEYPKDKRPPLPDKEKFGLGISANTAADDPTSIVVKWPTAILKYAGCETLEEAKSMLDEVEFFSVIIDPLFTTGAYYADMWLESPKYKKAHAAAEAKAKAQAQAVLRPVIETTATEVKPIVAGA